MRTLILLGVCSLIGGPFVAETVADEQSIPVEKLPKAVLKAAKSKFPKAEIKGAAKEVEDGKTTYEVMLKQKGRSIDIAFQADGTILEIEREVAADDLPGDVKKALKSHYPKAKINKAEEVREGEHGRVRYEISITTEVVITGKGQIERAEKGGEREESPSAKESKNKHREDRDDDEEEEEDEKPRKAVKAKVERSGKAERGEEKHSSRGEEKDDD
jgi:hypothetical protein